MTKYLEIKTGSISEVAIKLRDDYDALFKKELEKTGKTIPQMTPDEKKAFFNKIDKMHNAKDEQVKEEVKDEKTMLVVNPKDKKPGTDGVVRISKDKWPEYQKKGFIQAEATNPYAIGMAAAMKSTGDTPPLKKSTITKAHKIADKVKEEELTAGQKKLPPALQKAIEKKQKNEEVELEEGEMKAIATDQAELKRLDVRLSNLRDKKNAAAGADTTSIEKEILQTKNSLLDLKKKLASKKNEEVEIVDEAVSPDRITNLNDKISRLSLNLSKLDMSKPENKTKEAILKSDLNTAKLRLTDIQRQMAASYKTESKKNYKSYKKSLKNEHEKEKDNKKTTMTGSPITKVDVDPKIGKQY